MRTPILAVTFSACLGAPVLAQTEQQPPADSLPGPILEEPMTLLRLGDIISTLDPEAQFSGTSVRMVIEDIPILIVTDPTADRMRAMVPIRGTQDVTAEELMRVMQANFDTALDARYAVANDTLWAVFIHPLRPLEKNEFISAIGQTINLASTYGTLYTGGALSFGGGDSVPQQRQLIDKLLKKGEEI